MFKKILIANRGEIACRVIKSARRLGISTAAVFSEADRDAMHRTLADESVCIGPPPSAQSYLSAENILRACRETGAEALHPGYGFLSENADFAHRVEQAGVVFIGPSPSAITSMGDKLASKQIAAEAGVNVIPGYDGIVETAKQAIQVARELGYPVMLKASAGGGGKGMRVAYDDQQCEELFARAQSEAQSSFGDDRLLVEKLIENPRHIEIQVLADAHGKTIHLGERECSLQRRRQKVIEEAPSPFLDPATRAAMGNQAVALARAVQYRSAGTVEFIVDDQRQFYFLEMNTRLQVEHPVTEMVTGLDLVEWQIRIAAGEALTLSQEDVSCTGAAIEARIYAEDPLRNFLPSIGRIVRYLPPAERDGVRVDTGVYEGGEVSIHYDPMIAKLITYGAQRQDALARMRTALNEFYIRGPAHNLSFLAALINHPRFLVGDVHTNLIAQEYPDGFRSSDLVHDDPALLVVVAASIHRRYMDRAAQISHQLPGYERRISNEWVVLLLGQQHAVQAAPIAGGYQVVHQGTTYQVQTEWQFGQPLFRAVINDRTVCIQVERRGMIYRLFHWGTQADVMAVTPRAAELLACMPPKTTPDTSKLLLSPMPGLLSQLTVSAGDEVAKGQDLAVIEAMKMENTLRAEQDGKVSQVFAQSGDTLDADQPILEFQ